MRSLVIRFLRVGLRTAHPCLPLFILLGLFFPALASAATPMVAAGWGHTVALKSDGTVVAWGMNGSGQLGDGTQTDRWSPLAVPGLTGVVEVAAGEQHTVALKSDGTVMAWGYNTPITLGGTWTNRLSPVAVPGLTGVAAVAAGIYHTVARKSDGTVVAWGSNAYGQLGDGTITDRLSPSVVPGLTGIVAVAAGYSHTVALKSDGTVVAWGWNNSGELGDGTTTNRSSPVAAPGLTGVVAVAAGYNHTVALKSDGTVVAWGSNAYGQLGDGTTTDRSSPVAVPGLTGVVAVAAGINYTVALKSDGTVVAWGSNIVGQLGDGTTTDRSSPVAVLGLTGVVAVASGYHTVALKFDGTLVAWGRNGNGELGDGTTTQRNNPVAVPGLQVKTSQTIGAISFSPTTLAIGGTTASATATSGFAVSFSSMTPSVCTVSGSTVTGVTAGTCTIAADQAGNANYNAAPQVTQSIIISITLNLAPSWNLLGNSVNAPLTVAATFGDATKVSTVWKWIAATAKWAFYTPSLADGGVAYAASKGYDFLSTINGGESFWVNAKAGFTASLPTGTAVTTASFQDKSTPPNPLPTGWSLISVGGNPTPVAFNNGIGLVPPVTGTIAPNLTTLWAWDSASTNWYFYAPNLDTNGTLASYITSKSYLSFGTKPLDPAMGFWVNRPASGTTGGGSTTTATAEGFWIGTSSTGYNVALAVLENGETWGLYSYGNTIYGALFGNTSTSGSSLSGTGTDYNILARTATPRSYSGTVTSKASIAVTTSSGSSFNGTYRSLYDQSPSLTSLAGTYSGYGVYGTSTTQYFPVTVSSAGGVSAGSQALGCIVSGSVTPRASGKNVFNLSVTFTGINCALGNGTTTTGIAILDTTVTPNLLYAMALKSDKSDGFIWTGTR